MNTYINKIDAVKFATFIAYIQRIDTSSLDEFIIREIMSYINDLIPPADVIAKQACAQEVRDMLIYMAEGRNINAIKAIRSLTGDGLKESKDLYDNARTQKYAQTMSIHYEDGGSHYADDPRNG